jgi:hypothetical protein
MQSFSELSSGSWVRSLPGERKPLDFTAAAEMRDFFSFLADFYS